MRANGSRLDVRDRLVRVAQVDPGGSVVTCSERLSCRPFRYDDLVVGVRG